MATAFSSADAAVIEHEVELDDDAVRATAAHTHQEVEHVYCVERTARDLVWVPGTDERITPPLRRVALQFPDEALIDSVPLFHALQRALARLTDAPPQLYILADTSYGSCCVDEVAAAHVQADAVVHYGHTCLSPTAQIPALYVFPRHEIDVSAAVDALHTAADGLPQDELQALVLTYDVAYAHAIDHLYTQLRPQLRLPLVLSHMDTQRTYTERLAARQATATSTAPEPRRDPPTALSTSLLGAGRHVDLPDGVALTHTGVLYLGPPSRALTHLLLALGPQHPVVSYDPRTQRTRTETGTTNKLLMRRYATIQKARDASVIGLVIGTLGVQNYLPLVRELRRVLTSPVSQRKVYTISVGKLNPAKLANFQEIDAFVLVACPENSLLDTKEFLRPIVTPWEMMLAVRAHSGNEVPWTGDYVLDLSAAVRDAEQVATDEVHEEQPHYSFATGTYVTRTRYGRQPDDDAASAGGVEGTERALQQLNVAPHELAVRDASGRMVKVLDSAALQHHQQRSWVGLDRNEGAGAPAQLEQGMAGFAQHYWSADGEGEGTPAHASRDDHSDAADAAP
ncbi:Diphthamide biosynthesis protein 2 [Malassezia brasiliensis]|uniref:2-(3-amino-3-carboxypropyl)histidine synthase subunit 2 n=1 Tax=Malassezia brasiliensis TaxID=1821822 RepID=A0AAF0DVI5_9BASI|nr:Diphthamide biosynthesis protein 2 [Malassezia brasiliensis]